MLDAIPFLLILGWETFVNILFYLEGGNFVKLVGRGGIAKASEHGHGIRLWIRFDIKFARFIPAACG